jgi:hypothetical protein
VRAVTVVGICTAEGMAWAMGISGGSRHIAFLPGSVDLVLCCLLSRLCEEQCLFLCASGFRCVSRDSGWPDMRIGPFTDSDSLVLRAGRLASISVIMSV